MSENELAHPRIAAGVLFFDEYDRVLLVRPSYKPHWDIPGGYVEQGESPLQGCRREVKEELGITPPLGQLLVVDWAPNSDEGDKILYIFDGGQLSRNDKNRIKLESDELTKYTFKALEHAKGLLTPRLQRRLAAAIHAHREGRTLYLESGTPTNTNRQFPLIPTDRL